MEFRIVDYNYAFQSNIGLTASSADTSFPVTNLRSHIRSKAFRTKGFWRIDSTNNKLDFKDAIAGGEKTATIASGDYTTPTLMAAAIDTALEAAGAHDYTVTFSSTTGVWTIASNNSEFELLWSSGTNTATTIGAEIGFDITTDYTGAASYTGSSIAIHGSSGEWVLFDLKSAEDIDSFALLFDPMSGPKFSNAAVLKIQAHVLDTWSSPSVDVTLSLQDDFDIVTKFWSSAQSYRYWRFSFSDQKNPNLYLEVPKIVLGKATQLSRIPENGFSYSLLDQSIKTQNAYGHEYADTYPSRQQASFNLHAISYANMKTLEDIHKRLGRVTPLLVALDPLEASFDQEQFCIYGKFTEAFQSDHLIGAYFDSSLTILEAM